MYEFIKNTAGQQIDSEVPLYLVSLLGWVVLGKLQITPHKTDFTH